MKRNVCVFSSNIPLLPLGTPSSLGGAAAVVKVRVNEGRKEGSEKSVRVFFIMFKVIFINVTYYSFRFPLVLKR